MVPTQQQVVIEVVAPDEPAAVQTLRSYMDDVASRYYGRQASEAEIADGLREHPSSDLTPPSGLLLLARQDDVALGCAGLYRVDDTTGEVRRLFVAHTARGRGIATRLMGELERHARELGLSVLRLDTRTDLVESRRLYAALGYQEVPAFSGGPYSEHWFAKSLS